MELSSIKTVLERESGVYNLSYAPKISHSKYADTTPAFDFLYGSMIDIKFLSYACSDILRPTRALLG